VAKKTRSSSRTTIQRQELPSLPSSNVISIEKGEGLVDISQQDTQDFDAASDDVPRLLESVDSVNNFKNEHTSEDGSYELYKSDEVVRLCDGINRQNRMAKVWLIKFRFGRMACLII
jgi:hypothetical protein